MGSITFCELVQYKLRCVVGGNAVAQTPAHIFIAGYLPVAFWRGLEQGCQLPDYRLRRAVMHEQLRDNIIAHDEVGQ